MASTYDLYQRLTGRPFGRRVFSTAYAFKAPYFASVRPFVTQMAPNHASVRIRKRRAVQNHIGTVHAIAVANGLEAALGLLCEASVPAGMRWIPKGIELDYLAKVPTDVRCEARTEPSDWAGEPPFQVDVRCSAFVDDGTEVVRGVIPVWVTARPHEVLR
ncbi:hotdog fold domain-containing protein [Allobranchiibius sp. GilTou38]|uniref:DUF4442 domain-containing protein n=1 Tax=Allobranchiibius sp. GilTou38 TaxID=2815210 RepID=UPI001AA14726|nr:DUF4442 domain-containing protein [Allobranchiibius sp. GilTou38]